MKFLTPAVMALLGYVEATKLNARGMNKNMQDTCANLERREGYQRSTADGQVIENLYIYSPPDNDTSLFINHKNVTVRNVVIHHAANSRGLYFWDADGLTIENVEVIAYGVHESGPSPCPSRRPFGGYSCNNIYGYKSDDLVIKNVSVEGGSKGISV